jgi:uridine monophosphate synthetase
MTFWEKLEQSVRRRNSLVCVGLDPRPGRLPARYTSVTDFMRGVVDKTAEYACIYKPNIAFFEAMGQKGFDALRETLAYIPQETPVLLDAKRNDIGSTAEAYARAAFEVWGVDAVTVTPYLGGDGVQPFTRYRDRGVFVLCKTSNPTAGEVQDWSRAGEALYEHVARLASTWADGGEIGLVIGATYPDAMAMVRAESERTWFLVPGVGAQGGDLEAALEAGLRADGSGMIINSSRGIIYADDPAEAARSLRDAINAVRERGVARPSGERVRKRQLARALFEAECVRFGDFVLHSGAHSPVYVDLRRLVTYPAIMKMVARAYAELLAPLTYDRIAAIPYAGLPIGTAVGLEVGRPVLYPRREAKSYGTRRAIEGEFQAGERAILLDDLITSGGSKLEAMEPLNEAGLEVRDVVVLIDREQGGRQDLAAQGYRLHAALTLRELVTLLADDGVLARSDAEAVLRYLTEAAS